MVLATGALAGAATGCDGAGFVARDSVGFPLRGTALGILLCALKGCGGAAAAEEFDDFKVPAFFASLSSKGEPFSMEPKPGVSSARASPPETAPSSFGSAGSIPTVSSSAVETGLSEFVFGVAPVVASSLLALVFLASDRASVILIAGFAKA